MKNHKISAFFYAFTALSVFPALALADELILDSREYRPAFREVVDGRVSGDPAEDCAFDEFQVKELFSWVKSGNLSLKTQCQQTGSVSETTESRDRRERAEQEGRAMPSPEYRGQEVFNLKISLDVQGMESFAGQTVGIAKSFPTESACKSIQGEAEKLFLHTPSSDKIVAQIRCVAIAPSPGYALEIRFKFKETDRRDLASLVSHPAPSGETRALRDAQASGRSARPEGWGQRSPAVLLESIREASMAQ